MTVYTIFTFVVAGVWLLLGLNYSKAGNSTLAALCAATATILSVLGGIMEKVS